MNKIFVICGEAKILAYRVVLGLNSYTKKCKAYALHFRLLRFTLADKLDFGGGAVQNVVLGKGRHDYLLVGRATSVVDDADNAILVLSAVGVG